MKLLTYPQLRNEKGIPYSREHIRRLEAAGRFPRRAKLGDHSNAICAWAETEIDEYIAARFAKRDAKGGVNAKAS